MEMLNTLWVLVCVALVFLMQGGFLCLESGLTRSKDAINVALKNMTDFSISVLLYWAFGFALMFGASRAGWIGTTYFFVSIDRQGSALVTAFLFQAMFCATAATIVSGAVSGRMRFAAYIITTLIVSGLVYPVFGHWAWGGAAGGVAGWLAARGFVDFAGSTVVHSVGGWAALAAVFVIGPRNGRFRKDQPSTEIPGSNLPLAMLGAMLLWVGWIGFNGGSTLAMNEQAVGIIGNTFLAGAAGMVTALFVGWALRGYADVNHAINGSLAGLVAITASCHAVTSPSAVVIGSIGGIVMLSAQWVMNRRKIDDAIGVVPVHLAAGVWGTLAVALFGNAEILGTGLSRWEQLQAQLMGVCAAFAIAFGTSYLLLRLIHTMFSLRVTPEQEEVGLNVAEHQAGTELHRLLSEMDRQQRTGDFSKMVTVDPGTDVAQIAAQYNSVLYKVAQKTNEADRLVNTANLSQQHFEQAHADLESTVGELREFNQLAEGRELRMVELKTEINDLATQLGEPNRYQVGVDDDLQFADASKRATDG